MKRRNAEVRCGCQEENMCNVAASPLPRYCVVSDNDGHSYCIPALRIEEWNRFMEIPEDDERSWDIPKFAVRIDGRFTFALPSYA